MSNLYQAFTNNIIAQAVQDQRIRPWKSSVNTRSPIPKEEWVTVCAPPPDQPGFGVRSIALPVAETDARTNSFPMGELNALTNVFPMGNVTVLTNASPV
ncbi:hypothetical protein SCARD494_03056 [Seiridium cardinale]